jgi:hypothetical protein
MSCRYWNNSAGGREIVTRTGDLPEEREVGVVVLLRIIAGFLIASLFDYKLMLGMEYQLPSFLSSKYSKKQQDAVRVI